MLTYGLLPPWPDTHASQGLSLRASFDCQLMSVFPGHLDAFFLGLAQEPAACSQQTWTPMTEKTMRMVEE